MSAVQEQIRETLLDPNRSRSADLSAVDAELLFFSESILIEDYLEGSLSESESALFRQNFLVTDERRDLLNEIRLLKRYSSGSYEFDAKMIDQVEERKLHSSRRNLVLALVAVSAAVLVLMWLLFLR